MLKIEREDVSTSSCSIFVHVVSFVINVNNFTPGHHGYTNTVKEEHSSYTLRQCMGVNEEEMISPFLGL